MFIKYKLNVIRYITDKNIYSDFNYYMHSEYSIRHSCAYVKLNNEHDIYVSKALRVMLHFIISLLIHRK